MQYIFLLRFSITTNIDIVCYHQTRRFQQLKSQNNLRMTKTKRQSPLVGAILNFADPITDILTLLEFYSADYKT